MNDITAIVLTKNESKNIVDCLVSVKDLADRIIVVDSGSTDNTVELAQNHGAEVCSNKFEYYAQQFNWALDNMNISTTWVIRLDADERFTPELCKEIKDSISKYENTDVNGFVLDSWYYFLGRCLKRISKRKLMIFKYEVGRIEDRKRDAHTVLSEGKSIVLTERFVHYDFKDIDSFITKYNWYATREAIDFLEYKNGKDQDIATDKEIRKRRMKKFKIYYKAPMFLRAWLWFFTNYIIKGGFLDGREGYIYHVMSSFWYRYLVDAKIYEYEEKGKEIDALRSL